MVGGQVKLKREEEERKKERKKREKKITVAEARLV